jgi:hypothetical protein
MRIEGRHSRLKAEAVPEHFLSPVAAREPKRGLLRWVWLRARRTLIYLRWVYFVKVWKMNIDPTAHFSLRSEFDRTHPSGVHIGRESYIAFGAVILTHDMTRGLYALLRRRAQHPDAGRLNRRWVDCRRRQRGDARRAAGLGRRGKSGAHRAEQHQNLSLWMFVGLGSAVAGRGGGRPVTSGLRGQRGKSDCVTGRQKRRRPERERLAEHRCKFVEGGRQGCERSFLGYPSMC